MECKEIEKKISAFLQGEMDHREMEAFIFHMEECEGCYEELSIQYLVEKGMERLEDGNALDLNKELNNKMNEAKRRIKFYHSIQTGLLFWGIIAVLSILLFLLIKVII